MIAERGKVRLSDRIIFGLLAVAVLSSKNLDQTVPDGFFLTYSTKKFFINQWWGKKSEFLDVLVQASLPSVKIDFSNWEQKKDNG
jgi:hypothetical protein